MTTHDLIQGLQAAISAGLITAYSILAVPAFQAAGARRRAAR